MPITFFNEAADMSWLISVHLSDLKIPVEFIVGSAVIEGNEDYPTTVKLWRCNMPRYDQAADLTYVVEGDKLVLKGE